MSQQTLLPKDLNLTTESTVGENERNQIISSITPVLVALVVLGFIGNIIILHAICTVPRFKRVENLMLANLSAASILLIISTISLYIQMTHEFNFYGPLYCKFYPGIYLFMFPAEGFTMMCVSLERTQRARFPLRRGTKLSAIKKIGLVWFLALLLDLPRGFLSYTYNPGDLSLVKCHNVTKQILGSWISYAIYMTTNYLLTYLLPSFWLTRDWIRLVSQLRFLISCQTLPLQNDYRKRQKKLIRHAIIFTSIFIAIKVPAGTTFLLYHLPSEMLSETTVEWVKAWKTVFFTASILHSSFYPFIIFALSRDIRKYLSCCDDHPRHSPVPRF